MIVKNKMGISVMISYILLVVFAVTISAVVFLWLKTYIPAKSLECPEGVSVFINDATFNRDTRKLNLTITNNGRFNVSGYFVNIKNNSEQELATISINDYLNEEESSATKHEGVVLFSAYLKFDNDFKPENKETHFFNIPNNIGTPLSVRNIGTPLSVRIIPIRFQEYNEKQRIVSCGEASFSKEILILGVGENPDFGS